MNNMRKYAFLRDNVVVKVDTISEEQYISDALSYQLIVDIEDLLVQPQIGWVLNGNSLIPGVGQTASVHDMIVAKLTSYQKIAPELLKDLYANNTLMGITAAQSDAMFDEYHDVILRLAQGAFPTAIYRLQQKQPSGFVTQQMIDAWIAQIQENL